MGLSMIKKNDSNAAFSFVVAVNDEKVFQNNVLASPVFRAGNNHEIIARRGFSSAGIAYNDAMSAANNDIIVFMHQDIYLPDDWDMKLKSIIETLEHSGVKWGVLGCFGISLRGQPVGHVYSNGLNSELGFPQGPVRATSLDEIVLILRKSSGLHFDPRLSHFHLYGADICMESKKRGYENYVVSNYCIHNSLPINRLPEEFWQCAEYLRDKWRGDLPIKTTCVTISSLKIIMNMKRTWSGIFTNQGFFNHPQDTRLSDPSTLHPAGR